MSDTPRIVTQGPTYADLYEKCLGLMEENEALRKEGQATLAQLGEYSLDCQLLARWVKPFAPKHVRDIADKWVPDRGEES